MKFQVAYLALMGLPTALGGMMGSKITDSAADEQVLNATGPSASIMSTSVAEPRALESQINALMYKLTDQSKYRKANDEHALRKQGLRKRAPITPTIPLPTTTTSTTSMPSTDSGSTQPTTSIVVTSTPSASELVGTFTAGGAAFGATSESGYVVIDGKTLSVGGPNALIAGVIVTEGSSGLIVAGTTVSFNTPLPSSVPAVSTTPAITSTSTAASKTAASQLSSSSSSKGAAAVATSGVGAGIAAVAAVVGILAL